MNKKQIIRMITQTLLLMISSFTILTFYQSVTPSILIKKIITVALIVANCIYNDWCGSRNSNEIIEVIENRMRELREESFNKIADMVVEEKANDRAVE